MFDGGWEDRIEVGMEVGGRIEGCRGGRLEGFGVWGVGERGWSNWGFGWRYFLGKVIRLGR